jgi:alkylation response protein AidB-like acyl-CoA dehydrogenase
MGYLEIDVKIKGKLKAFQESARKFGMEIMRPAGIELDKLTDPSDVIDKDSVLWDVFKKFREQGFHKLIIPKAYGGTMGTLPSLALTLLNEQLCYADPGLGVSLTVACMPYVFATMSPEAEVRNWAHEFAEDKEANFIGCWALTEPDHGTDWVMGIGKTGGDPRRNLSVRGVKKGDEYIINGQKAAWVSNGTIASHAVLHIGLDESKGVHGSGIALCPLDLPGISRSKPLDKLGQRPLNQGEIIFNDVKLHKKYMLFSIPGIFGANSFGKTLFGLANSQMGVAFSSHARACLDEAFNFAKENTRNGLLLAEQEDIKLKIFRMFSKVETARLFSRKVADHLISKISGPVFSALSSSKATFWAAGQSLRTFENLYNKYDSVQAYAKKFTHPEEPSGLMEWSKYGIASKINATETALSTAEDAFQIMGEKSQSPDYPIEKMLRDARASLIEDGVNDSLAITAFEEL